MTSPLLLEADPGPPERKTPRPFQGRGVGPPRYHPAWPAPHGTCPLCRLRPEPPAVTGGPVRAYLASVKAVRAAARGGCTPGSAAGLAPSPARFTSSAWLLVPVVAFAAWIVPVRGAERALSSFVPASTSYAVPLAPSSHECYLPRTHDHQVTPHEETDRRAEGSACQRTRRPPGPVRRA